MSLTQQQMSSCELYNFCVKYLFRQVSNFRDISKLNCDLYRRLSRFLK